MTLALPAELVESFECIKQFFVNLGLPLVESYKPAVQS
jgi:hypothetical protein